eukprot:7295513-Pyramimonas_sp.AAC.1
MCIRDRVREEGEKVSTPKRTCWRSSPARWGIARARRGCQREPKPKPAPGRWRPRRRCEGLGGPRGR